LVEPHREIVGLRLFALREKEKTRNCLYSTVDLATPKQTRGFNSVRLGAKIAILDNFFEKWQVQMRKRHVFNKGYYKALC